MKRALNFYFQKSSESLAYTYILNIYSLSVKYLSSINFSILNITNKRISVHVKFSKVKSVFSLNLFIDPGLFAVYHSKLLPFNFQLFICNLFKNAQLQCRRDCDAIALALSPVARDTANKRNSLMFSYFCLF